MLSEAEIESLIGPAPINESVRKEVQEMKEKIRKDIERVEMLESTVRSTDERRMARALKLKQETVKRITIQNELIEIFRDRARILPILNHIKNHERVNMTPPHMIKELNGSFTCFNCFSVTPFFVESKCAYKCIICHKNILIEEYILMSKFATDYAIARGG
jgi:hypothetical protein